MTPVNFQRIKPEQIKGYAQKLSKLTKDKDIILNLLVYRPGSGNASFVEYNLLIDTFEGGSSLPVRSSDMKPFLTAQDTEHFIFVLGAEALKKEKSVSALSRADESDPNDPNAPWLGADFKLPPI